MDYAIVIEKSGNGYGAYVPDVPGCYAFGESVDEVKALIREGIAFHFEGLREDGEPIPEATAIVDLVHVT